MKVDHCQRVESKPVETEGASGVTIRHLVGESDGAPNFTMRHFEIAPGGNTPRHSHPFEHEAFVLQGEGVVYEGDVDHPLKAGDFVFVEPGEVHQFRNTGQTPMQLLCLVPNSAHAK